jgi:hypothetical protein
MRFLVLALAFIAAILPIAESRADNCQFTFRCQGNICERVLPEACSTNIPASSATVVAPSHTATFVAPALETPPAGQSFVGSEQRPGLPSNPIPPGGAGCSENGSCYGDISNINGMPKTNHVNGYFRRDGTYVRGHYRSSGRR